MKKSLNKYVHITPCNDEFLLYNTINEAIVALQKSKVNGKEVILEDE